MWSCWRQLLVRASSTGREEVVFSTEDREGAGKAAVARANELAKEAAPERLGDGVVANLLNKVAAGVSAFRQGTAMLAGGDPRHLGRLHPEGWAHRGQLHL